MRKLTLKERMALLLVHSFRYDEAKGGFYKCRWNDFVAHIGGRVMPFEELKKLLQRTNSNIVYKDGA